jgi:hypothetical protein
VRNGQPIDLPRKYQERKVVKESEEGESEELKETHPSGAIFFSANSNNSAFSLSER